MLLTWKSGQKGFAQTLLSEPLWKRFSVTQLWALAQLTPHSSQNGILPMA